MNPICAFFERIKEILMNLMPGGGIDLDKPLAWKSANPNELKLLQNLQGNILKGHGRHSTSNIFFKFGTDSAKSKGVLREIAECHLTNAYQQLLDAEEYKASQKSGGRFSHLALTHKGYQALGLADQSPADSDFQMGMKDDGSRSALNDPSVDYWEKEFQGDIHGVLLVADDTRDGADKFAQELIKLLQDAGAYIAKIQAGEALFNEAKEGIEHFGYVDGRSQPLLLVEDIAKEAETAGIAKWDPAFPISAALVPDPGANDSYSFGSYFIFRKLEQNVQGFKDREQQVATELGLPDGEERELAGALIVGRFEDGTPVTVSNEAKGLKPPNDFNYNGDSGSRCPFHAHIRKVNPRGTGGAEPESEERKHIMPRRGIPFEDQKRVPISELPEVETYKEFQEKVFPCLPKGGVGLLFMAYNSNIGNQFKFTQQLWANNTNFPIQPAGPHGIDPVIGQEKDKTGKYPNEWDNPAKGTKSADFGGFVTFKGGDYFFAPSLTFLKNL